MYDLSNRNKEQKDYITSNIRQGRTPQQILNTYKKANSSYYKSFADAKLALEAARHFNTDIKTISNTAQSALRYFTSSERNNFLASNNSFVPLRLTEYQLKSIKRKVDFNKGMTFSNFYDEYNNLLLDYHYLPIIEDIDNQYRTYTPMELMRTRKSVGGIVEGEDNVPFTKEDPADRVDPFTGEPYQEQMSRLGFKEGGPHYNNMGNIESRFDYWAGMTGETYGQDGRFGVFDSPVSGMRASLRDIKTKQNRYKDTDNPLGHAVAEYLGGGREGTLDQKIQRATGQPNTSNYNPDVQGYINDVVFKYKRDGDEGIIDAIAMREAASREAANYYIKNKEAKQKAVELAKHSFPKGTTTKQMLEFLNSLNN
jgi:hypothetical protein